MKLLILILACFSLNISLFSQNLETIAKLESEKLVLEKQVSHLQIHLKELTDKLSFSPEINSQTEGKKKKLLKQITDIGSELDKINPRLREMKIILTTLNQTSNLQNDATTSRLKKISNDFDSLKHSTALIDQKIIEIQSKGLSEIYRISSNIDEIKKEIFVNRRFILRFSIFRFNYPVRYENGGTRNYTFFLSDNSEIEPFPFNNDNFEVIQENKTIAQDGNEYILRETGMLGGKNNSSYHLFMGGDYKISKWLYGGIELGYGVYEHTGVVTIQKFTQPSHYNFPYTLKTDTTRVFHIDAQLTADLIRIFSRKLSESLDEKVSLVGGVGFGTSSNFKGILELATDLLKPMRLGVGLKYYYFTDNELYIPSTQPGILEPIAVPVPETHISYRSGTYTQKQNRWYYGVTLGISI